jgi:RimJ/RimL family protein N-acetyltransferase
MEPEVRRLTPDDAAALARLRRESLERDPLAFGSSVDADPHGSEAAFRESLGRTDEVAVFGAFAGTELVGMVGIARSPRGKRRHKAGVWGMYVAKPWRRRGLGRRLMEQAIARACEWPQVEELALSVTTAAPGARRLYESLGFRPWGTEPRAILFEGRYEDEIHLVLTLDAADRLSPKAP